MGDVTLSIAQAREGERAAFDRIFELLYPELRQIAHRRLTRRAEDGLIETTVLVSECYLKLLKRGSLAPADRAHFLGYAAAVMRSIIVDAARAAHTERRGGDAEQVTLNTGAIDAAPNPAGDILDVHAALDDLVHIEPRLARIVEMRYFAGMSDDEIGAALELSARTVRRNWEKARLLLAHALRG